MFNLGSKVNAITLAYVSKLGLKICRINVGAQKIDDSIFKTFKMVPASFLLKEVRK